MKTPREVAHDLMKAMGLANVDAACGWPGPDHWANCNAIVAAIAGRDDENAAGMLAVAETASAEIARLRAELERITNCANSRHALLAAQEDVVAGLRAELAEARAKASVPLRYDGDATSRAHDLLWKTICREQPVAESIPWPQVTVLGQAIEAELKTADARLAAAEKERDEAHAWGQERVCNEVVRRENAEATVTRLRVLLEEGAAAAVSYLACENWDEQDLLNGMRAWATRARAALGPVTPINQCDGCSRGIPVTNGTHRDPGGNPWEAMYCTVDRYAAGPGEGKAGT